MKTKTILKRFIRAFFAGAFSVAVPLLAVNIKNLDELNIYIAMLCVSMTVGGINGVILAGDKLLRWKK